MFCTEVSLCYGTKAITKHHLCFTITTPSVSGPTFALSGEIQAQVTFTCAPFLYNYYNYNYSFSRDQFTQFKHHFWGGGGRSGGMKEVYRVCLTQVKHRAEKQDAHGS